MLSEWSSDLVVQPSPVLAYIEGLVLTREGGVNHRFPGPGFRNKFQFKNTLQYQNWTGFPGGGGIGSGLFKPHEQECKYRASGQQIA